MGEVSKLRTAVDPHGVAVDPAGLIGGKESDDIAHIVRLAETLQRLNAKREVAPCIGLGEARHVGRDGAGRHGVDADAPFAKIGSEMLH